MRAELTLILTLVRGKKKKEKKEVFLLKAVQLQFRSAFIFSSHPELLL